MTRFPSPFFSGIPVSYSLRPEDIHLVDEDLDTALGKVAIELGGSARCGSAPDL